MNLFPIFNNREMSDFIADHLPSGLPWNNKRVEGSGIRGLIKTGSECLIFIQSLFDVFKRNQDVRTSVEFLDEWLESVALPDSCQITFETDEDKRLAILARLANQQVRSKSEVEAYISGIVGREVTVIPGIEFDPSDPDGRNKIYITFSRSGVGFPYDFPYPFGIVSDPSQSVSSSAFPQSFPYAFDSAILLDLMCVLENIIPANVSIVII